MSEKLPAAQSVQATLPVVDLCFPATQAKHGPLFGPVYPALHTQLALPAAELAFPVQLMQVLDDLAPTCAEYWLTRQEVQAEAAGASA